MQRAVSETAAPDIGRMSGVRFSWRGRRAFSLSVDDFGLRARERVLLVGPSGAGKSTFLSLLCGIVTPQGGELDVLGTDTARLSSSGRDHFRSEHFGIIFQMFNLLPYGSILDNVLLPLSFAKKRAERARRKGGADAEALRLLTSLGLDLQELDGLSTASLSVGQQQRVAAARALIGGPELIVADEPTSALDRDRQLAFLDLLFAEIARRGRKPHHGQPRGGAGQALRPRAAARGDCRLGTEGCGMIVPRLALQSLRNRALTASLTVLAIAFSVMLLLGVEKVRTGARQSFADTISGTDLIVGARSGAIQLLLDRCSASAMRRTTSRGRATRISPSGPRSTGSCRYR